MQASNFDELITTLNERFVRNMRRHSGIEWSPIQAKLAAHPEKLKVLQNMEQTGGEPDVIGYDANTDEFIFCDCSPESPVGRRSLCYDQEALDSRKENKPIGNVVDMATAIGIKVLTEQQYRGLQELGEFDKKTSSWITTPPNIRARGGAIFCDRRYDHVFTYHNGADSYYSARGFRGLLKV
jgi:hypothetical protein